MFRCLALDPVVARPAVDGPHPVQLRPLCLFNPAVVTRPGFAAPFRPVSFTGRGNVAIAGRKPAGLAGVLSCRAVMAHSDQPPKAGWDGWRRRFA